MRDSEMTSRALCAGKSPSVPEPVPGAPRLRGGLPRPQRPHDRGRETEPAPPHRVVVVQGMRITLPGLRFMDRTLPPRPQ